jgi:hypothetical protein
MAVSCSVRPAARLGAAGVTEMELKVGDEEPDALPD